MKPENNSRDRQFESYKENSTIQKPQYWQRARYGEIQTPYRIYDVPFKWKQRDGIGSPPPPAHPEGPYKERGAEPHLCRGMESRLRRWN